MRHMPDVSYCLYQVLCLVLQPHEMRTPRHCLNGLRQMKKIIIADANIWSNTIEKKQNTFVLKSTPEINIQCTLFSHDQHETPFG